ncbi:MAG: TIGR00341 family protein [Methanoregula sp.]
MNFIVLLALATVIATYGVVTDSTASVIGAMIIAPLMTPIMASAAAVILGSTIRLRQALRFVALGILGVIVLSILLTFFIPDPLISFPTNSQITSRVSPGLLDLMIALAAGAAGAYAIARQEIADSLAGVAIAISLVPPLCVVGISLAKGQWMDSGGAFLLFLTNFFAILLAGALVFRILGLEQLGFTDQSKAAKRTAIRLIVAGMLLITILLAATTYNAYQVTYQQTGTADAVEEWLGTTSFQTVGIKIGPSDVDITIRGDSEMPPLTNLYTKLNTLYGHPTKITLHVIPYKSQSYPS